MFASASLFVSFWSLIQNVVALRKRSYENVKILAVASGSRVSFCLSRRDLSCILLLLVLAALGWGRLEVNPSVWCAVCADQAVDLGEAIWCAW